MSSMISTSTMFSASALARPRFSGWQRPDVYKRQEEVCAEMGLSMTTAFTIFAKKVSREHRIPFEVSADPFYSCLLYTSPMAGRLVEFSGFH